MGERERVTQTGGPAADEDATANADEDATIDAVEEDLGGDAACWLPRLCADCGAMIEGPIGTACWRCGGTRREGDD